MLRRKPTKIDVGIEDKDEIEELRRTVAMPPAGASAVLQQIDRPLSNLPSKSQRIGIVKSSSAASS